MIIQGRKFSISNERQYISEIPISNYIFPQNEIYLCVSSSSVKDNQFVTILGLNSNYEQIEETIQLNGFSPIKTTKSFYRINSVILNEACRGTVYVYDSTETSVESGIPRTNELIKTAIVSGDLINYNGVFTVPKDMTLMITRMTVDIESDDLTLLTNVSLQNETLVSILQNTFTVGKTQLDLSAMISEKTDITFLANAIDDKIIPLIKFELVGQLTEIKNENIEMENASQNCFVLEYNDFISKLTKDSVISNPCLIFVNTENPDTFERVNIDINTLDIIGSIKIKFDETFKFDKAFNVVFHQKVFNEYKNTKTYLIEAKNKLPYVFYYFKCDVTGDNAGTYFVRPATKYRFSRFDIAHFSDVPMFHDRF